jgi:Zn-dependent protease with chaperone function
LKFLDYQAEARSNTFRLIALYGFGVLGLGAVSAIGVHFLLNLGNLPLSELSPQHWSLVATAAIATWGIIFLGSVWRTTQLGRGGKMVAESLGGTLLGPGAQNPLERRALNIVEEMALASGIAVPPVYILRREQGINAFAAGWSLDDAVIGLTDGAIKKLNRSELQGVVAHEFSHIVNRDTALNMRLIGILHGIVVLSLVGEFLLRARSSESNKKSAAPFFALGLGIWLFGSLGAFLAQLIQARVSREREFLADASAVQFTRHPDGIGRALAKIGLESSYLESSFGRAASHMLIAAAHEPRFFDFSSHPPLETRIRRLLPTWDGRLESLASVKSAELHSTDLTRPEQYRRVQAGPTQDLELLPMQAAFISYEPSPTLLAQGATSESPWPAAGFFTTPSDLVKSAREPFEARLLLLALMLDDEPRVRASQLTLLSALPQNELEALPRLATKLAEVDPPERLPLMQLALGSLASLSSKQAQYLATQVRALRLALPPLAHRAFCVGRLTLRHLDEPRAGASLVRRQAPLVRDAIGRLLGVIARRGNSSLEDAGRAFQAGLSHLPLHLRPSALPPLKEIELDGIDEALDMLLTERVEVRTQIVFALRAAAAEDGILRALEAELLNTFRVCLNVAVNPELSSPDLPGLVRRPGL